MDEPASISQTTMEDVMGSHSTNMRRALSVAALVAAIFGLSVPTGKARQSMTGGNGNRPAEELPDFSEGSVHHATLGIEILPLGTTDPRDLVGVGFRYKPEQGSFEPTQKVADLIFDPVDHVAADTVGYSQYLNSKERSRRLIVDYRASVSILGVKGATELAHDTVSSGSQLQTGFSLYREFRYEDKIADLRPAAVIYTPAAQAILDIQEPATRNLAWRTAFGDYVGVGYTMRGRLGLRVTLSDAQSIHDSATFLDTQGSYGPYGGSTDLALLAYEVLQSDDLGLGLVSQGGAALPAGYSFPTAPSMLETWQQQQEFLDAINTGIQGAKDNESLILFPAGALPAGPTFRGPNWDSGFLGEAVMLANHAADALLSAYHWTHPDSRLAFLDKQTRPQGSDSYAWLLDQERFALVSAMDDLWDGMRDYLAEQNHDTMAAFRTVLVATQGRLRSLEELLIELHDLARNLPPVEIVVYENIDQPAGEPYWMPTTIEIELRNVAIFDDWSPGSGHLAEALQFVDAASERATITLYEDQTVPGTYSVPHVHGADMTDFIVLEDQPILQGPGIGLRNLRFQTTTWLHSQSPQFRVRVVDNLLRSDSMTVNVADDHGF